MSAPVLSRPLIAQAGRRPLSLPHPREEARKKKRPAATPRPPPTGSRPGGPQEAARREGRFPLAGSRGTGPRGRSLPRPGAEGCPPTLSPGGSPPSESGPLSPTLRANPFPEVTDPFCRLPLPTLFRWLEALHLGDLMRLWVRPGGNTIAVPQVFMGRWGASRTPRRLGRPASRPALSPSESIPGPSGRVPRRTRATVREEREPSSGPPPASLGSLALPRRSVPRHGSGILTRFPFGRGCDPPPLLAERPGCVGHTNLAAAMTRDHTPSERDLPYALGSTNPCPTAVHMEPFPTSALKAPV